MAQPGNNTSLSLPARLLCYLGPPSTIIFISYLSPRTALLSPLALAPTAIAYANWHKHNQSSPSHRGELEPMIWTFTLTSTLGITTVIFAQLAVMRTFLHLLFRTDPITRKAFWTEFTRNSTATLTPSELTFRSTLAHSWQNHAFNAALSFLAAAVVEETLKYLPIIYARRRHHHTHTNKNDNPSTAPEDRKKRPREGAYLDYALAAALGFGVAENLGFIYAACAPSAGEEANSWGKVALTAAERIVIGSLGHALTGALTALRATRRDFYDDDDDGGGRKMSWVAVVGPAMLFHGAWDFVALGFSAWEGNVGWIHPESVKRTVMMLGMAGGMIAVAARWVVREWRAMRVVEDSRGREK